MSLPIMTELGHSDGSASEIYVHSETKQVERYFNEVVCTWLSLVFDIHISR